MAKKDLDYLYLLNQFTNLITHSPSCSCVLNDLLELIVDSWGLESGYILIYNQQKGIFHKLGFVSKSAGLGEIENLTPELFVRTLEGQYELKTGIVKAKQFSVDEKGNVTLLTIPLLLENLVSGIFCFIDNNNSNIFSSEEIICLQLLTSQISQALERELLEEKTNSLRYRFDSVLDSLTEGIVIISNKKVTYSNKTAKILLNLSGSFIEKNINEFFQQIIELSENPLKTRIYLETAQITTHPTYFFEIETKEKKFLQFKKIHIKTHNLDYRNWGFSISDVTVNKETDKLKNDLLAIVSHELRTPLTSIKGNTSSLLRKDVCWSESEKKVFLQDIHDECDRLNELIEKLLDVSKINVGVLKLDKSLVKIEKLIEKIKTKIAPRYSGDNLEINFDINSSKSDVVLIDEQKILQVLLNLLDNAVKHGGKAVQVDICVKSHKNTVLFIIKDNGPGIPLNVLDKIFQKFYQFNKKKQESFGTGLGLAICKGFVEAHGGTIWAESTVGEGSTFYFTLMNSY